MPRARDRETRLRRLAEALHRAGVVVKRVNQTPKSEFTDEELSWLAGACGYAAAQMEKAVTAAEERRRVGA